MTTVNKTYYIDKFKVIEFCGTNIITFDGGAFQLPFEINPAEGDHNYEYCEGCRNQRDQLIKLISKKNIFPNCCEAHKKLYSLAQFNQTDFQKLEGTIADKVIYTSQFVINHLDDDDWLEGFENYFEYVLESMGSFPNGYGSPFQLNNFYNFTIEMIENNKDNLKSSKMSTDELNRRLDVILKYIHNAFIPVNEKSSEKNTDLNLLLGTYDRWYKTFPFDLTYFQSLQKKYSRTIPIIKGKIRYNKYTGLTTAKLHTKQSLTQFLVELTKEIITNINGLQLYEKGLLNDAEKIQLELILRNRELELIEINSNKEIDSREYIKTLKNWFKSEKKFIKEITPLLKLNPKSKETESKPKLTIKQIALKLVYEGVIVNRNNANEIIKNYGHTSGEKLFQEFTYYSSPQNRKGNPTSSTPKKFRNKITLFESVLELLEKNKRQRVTDELLILKTNYNSLFENL